MKRLDYEVVNLSEMLISVLPSVCVKNSDFNLFQKIEFSWKNFIEKYSGIENKVTGKPIVIYSNYESDEKGIYEFSIGCEVIKQQRMSKVLDFKKILKGKYAKFIVKGPAAIVVPEFWQTLWQMDLPRKFDCDFEEYQNTDMLNTEVHIFISIK